MKTACSLDKYFQEKDSILETLVILEHSLSREEASEKERLEKEFITTKECLAICAKFHGDLDQIRLKIFDICAVHGFNQVSFKKRNNLASANRILVSDGNHASFVSTSSASTASAGPQYPSKTVAPARRRAATHSTPSDCSTSRTEGRS